MGHRLQNCIPPGLSLLVSITYFNCHLHALILPLHIMTMYTGFVPASAAYFSLNLSFLYYITFQLVTNWQLH